MRFDYDVENHVVHADEAHLGPHPNLPGEEVAYRLNQLVSLLKLGFHVEILTKYCVVTRLELAEIIFNERGESVYLETAIRAAWAAGTRHLVVIVGKDALNEISTRIIASLPMHSFGKMPPDFAVQTLSAYKILLGNEIRQVPLVYDSAIVKDGALLVTVVLPEEKS